MWVELTIEVRRRNNSLPLMAIEFAWKGVTTCIEVQGDTNAADDGDGQAALLFVFAECVF